ncbi:MAG: hypothetical protein IT364_15335 [Candidatus Hydrogenedentes bacterium]|nr:hypothetical protein [Candidatus Hydrogenedentota bacterium]
MTRVVSKAPGLRLPAVLLAALSLSIGWGIRGNFGHEYGAMIPGALTAIAVCLVSGREDWRGRVPYFGMFGALGWGFGGSISYMQVIAYTHSGHEASQLYGFFGLFWIGFLWAGMGGAGTAWPAVVDRERLTQAFRPLLWVFAFWTVFVFIEEALVRWYEHYVWGVGAEGADTTWHRQKNPFYWFDSDWLQALFALAAICAFDLWDRCFSRNKIGEPLFHVPALIIYAGAGALVGGIGKMVLDATGRTQSLAEQVTYRLADLSAIDPATGMPKFDPENTLTNWPQFFEDVGPHLGWAFGMLAGIGLYFAIFGRFRSESRLFLYMALGWFAGFLLFPVLLSNAFTEIGGLRLTPPRGDDWAGITGVLFGTLLYLARNGLVQVAWASLVSAFIGGLGFSGAAWLKLMMVAPGNAERLNPEGLSPSPAAASEAFWAFWQSQNWHSFLEQSYGFFNGIGIAVAMGLLALRAPRLKQEDEGKPVRRWTLVAAVSFVLLLLTYVNLYKNVAEWTGSREMVQDVMRAPMLWFISMTAASWFNLTYVLLSILLIGLLSAHLRRPLAIVPGTWLGKGQLLYLVFLWVIVIGNFERALGGFTEQRLLTEWVIIVNAMIATALLLLLPREGEPGVELPVMSGAPIAKTVLDGMAVSLAAVFLMFASVYVVYGGAFAGHSGKDGEGQMRFGDKAEWRIRPILKNAEHS